MRKNYYNPLTHEGIQPIRVLQHNIISFFENTHPEFLQEASRIIKQNGLQISIGCHINEIPIIYGNSEYVSYIGTDKKIVIYETFLSYTWIICYSLFVLFTETVEKPALKRIHDQQFESKPEVIEKASDLLKYGLSLIKQYSKWDIERLPNPEEYNDEDAFYIEKANGIFLHAVNFFLLHEYAHVERGHIDSDIEMAKNNTYISDIQSKKDEYEADKTAMEKILKGAKDSNPKVNIEYGIIAGLCALIFIDNELKSSTHPDSDERVRIALEAMNLVDLDEMWGVASFAFIQWADYYGQKIDLPSEMDTYKDLFNHILKELEQLKK